MMALKLDAQRLLENEVMYEFLIREDMLAGNRKKPRDCLRSEAESKPVEFVSLSFIIATEIIINQDKIRNLE